MERNAIYKYPHSRTSPHDGGVNASINYSTIVFLWKRFPENDRFLIAKPASCRINDKHVIWSEVISDKSDGREEIQYTNILSIIWCK